MNDEVNSTKDQDKEQISNTKDSNDALTFEEALAKLEAHVRTLEQGELTLDQSLAIFEEGMKLATFCTKKLDEAEQKIEILQEKNGELVKEEFEVPE
jgi:exodeoxyribonuclease VII small subunit